MLVLAVLTPTYAQAGYKYQQNGKYFVQSSTAKTDKSDESTGYFWVDKDNVKYPIYISAKGRCFVWKTSKRTGKEYKQYLGEELSRAVCKELKREYVESKKKGK